MKEGEEKRGRKKKRRGKTLFATQAVCVQPKRPCLSLPEVKSGAEGPRAQARARVGLRRLTGAEGPGRSDRAQSWTVTVNSLPALVQWLWHYRSSVTSDAATCGAWVNNKPAKRWRATRLLLDSEIRSFFWHLFDINSFFIKPF